MPVVLGLSPSAPDPVPGSVDVRANSAAWGRTTSGYNLDDLMFIVNGSDTIWSTHRFGLAIPKGATITSAAFTPYASNNFDWSTVTSNITIGAEQADNPSQFSSSADALTRRGNRGTPVTWRAASTGTTINNGNPITGADLTSVIQAIVNRSGWVSGNNILLIGENISGTATAQWNGVNAAEGVRPRLVVNYLA